MSAFQTLRQARFLARCVLVWFVLAMGVAVAAPVVQPMSSTLVCSAAGQIKLVGADDGTTSESLHHTLDCVLCWAAGAPPSAEFAGPVAASNPSAVPQRMVSSRLAWPTAQPLAARGPPALL